MDISAKPELEGVSLTAGFMPRIRLDRILDNAVRCKLVYMIAGAGYGKTQAVYHYLKQQESSVIRWIQLSASDNIISHFWESIVHTVSMDNPDLAAGLRQLGFPETLARFKQFGELLRSTEHRSHKTYLVHDDFHVITDPQVLTFVERCAQQQLPDSCIILISRKEPEINTVSLFSKGVACIITEDELQFTEDEISDYFTHCKTLFSEKDIKKIAKSTNGWALALKMLSLIIEKNPHDLDRALKSAKQNIFKLLETEVFDNIPENAQIRLIQLSLTPDLPLTQLDETFHDGLLAEHAPQLVPFVWFDSFIGDHRVHPLFLEFLQSKQDKLSDEEKRDTYLRVAEWCLKNNLIANVIKYCTISRQYDRVLEVLLSCPFRMAGNTSEYFLSIIQSINTGDDEDSDFSVLMLRVLFIPLLLVGMSRFKEAEEHSFETISKWENKNTPLSYSAISAAYRNLSYINLYTCTVTNQSKSAEFLEKSLEYQKLSGKLPEKGTGAFLVADVRSFSCTVGEDAELLDFDKFYETSKEAAKYIDLTAHGMYCGYDDLVACEIAFFKNQLDLARNHAHRAILRAHERGQYSIAAMANGYLLRMAIHEGDYLLCKEILNQLGNSRDEEAFWNHKVLYDLFTGLFYAQIGLPEMAASWLTIDERESAAEVQIPVRELIVGVKCFIASEKFKQALTVLSNSYPRAPMHRFRLGELILTLLLSVVRLKLDDTESAIRDFEKAYTLSYDGVLVMPFIELGKDFRLLAAAASKQDGCTIPGDWLKTVERKASAYAKKAAVIAVSIKKEKNIKDDIRLSAREREILSDLYHGLSRDEMAATHYLSINTINKILQSIFIKLNATNSADAIRIAVERGMITTG
ncbi:MAG: LuxR C-terminal-related transcriptional regulator [Oscillospiraceae bacterium]|nr:LuxR C-terminal-related transcriptional regulator [Oscillospiraceae bacterium]